MFQGKKIKRLSFDMTDETYRRNLNGCTTAIKPAMSEKFKQIIMYILIERCRV